MWIPSKYGAMSGSLVYLQVEKVNDEVGKSNITGPPGLRGDDYIYCTITYKSLFGHNPFGHNFEVKISKFENLMAHMSLRRILWMEGLVVNSAPIATGTTLIQQVQAGPRKSPTA